MASRGKSSNGSNTGDKHEFSFSKKLSLVRDDVMTIPGPKLNVTGEGVTKWLENVRSIATECIGKHGKQLGLRVKLNYPFPPMIPLDNPPENMSRKDVEKQNNTILDRHFMYKQAIETKLESLYPKVWNHLTLSLQEKMKSHPDWKTIDTECDSFGLIMLAMSTAANQTTVLEIDLAKQAKLVVLHTTRTNLSSSHLDLSEKVEQLASLHYKLCVKRNGDDDMMSYEQFKDIMCFDSLASAILLQSVRANPVFQSAASHVIAEAVRDPDSFPSSVSSMAEALTVFNSAQTQTKQTSDTDELTSKTGQNKHKDKSHPDKNSLIKTIKSLSEKDQQELRAFMVNSYQPQNDSDKAGKSKLKPRKSKDKSKSKGTAKSNGDSKDRKRKDRRDTREDSYFSDGDRDEDHDVDRALAAYGQLLKKSKKPANSAHVNDNEDDSYVHVCKSLHPQELDVLEEQARQSLGIDSWVYSVGSSPRVPVIFDTGATVSTTCCRDVLTNVHRLKQPHRVGGVAAGVTVTAELGGFFGPFFVLLSDMFAPVVLISGYRAGMHSRILYSQGKPEDDHRSDVLARTEAHYVIPRGSEKVHIFTIEANSKLPVLSDIVSSKRFSSMCAESRLKAVSTDFDVQDRALVVRHAFTPREEKRAREARSIGEALSSMSDRRIAETIARGGIAGMHLTPHDFSVASKILGPSISRARGKAKYSSKGTQPQIEAWHPPFSLERRDQSLEMDVMSIEGMLILVSTSSPMDYTQTQWLNSNKIPDLVEGMEFCVDEYSKAGYRVTDIIWDAQKGLESNRSTLKVRGISITIRHGSKASRAERKIQTIKGCMRSDILNAPLTIFGYLLLFSVRWAVESINICHSETGPTDQISPYVTMYGVKPSIDSLRHPFGALFICKHPNTNPMESSSVIRPRVSIGMLIERPKGSQSPLFLDVDQLIRTNPGRIATFRRPMAQCTALLIVPEAVESAWNKGIKDKLPVFTPKFSYKLVPQEIPSVEIPSVVEVAGVQQAPPKEPGATDLVRQPRTAVPSRVAHEPTQPTSPVRDRKRQGDVLDEVTSKTHSNDTQSESHDDDSIPALIDDPDSSDDDEPVSETVLPGKAAPRISLEMNSGHDGSVVYPEGAVRPAGVDVPPPSKAQRTQDATRRKKAELKLAALPPPQSSITTFPPKPPAKRKTAEAPTHSAKQPRITRSGREVKHRDDSFATLCEDVSVVYITSEQTRVNRKLIDQVSRPASEQDPSTRQRNTDTLDAIFNEFKALLSKNTFKPVHFKDLSQRQRMKTLPSQMFLVTKFKPSGEYLKTKARLVCGGHRQEHAMYEQKDIASPTAGSTSLFSLAHIAAVERRHIMTIDVTAAYLNAPLGPDPEGDYIIMFLDPVLTKILSVLAPEYKKFIDAKTGKLYVKLDRALYGCIQSAKLWFDTITKDLAEMGFKPNPYDPCILNASFGVGDTQCSIALHVDDLFCSCKDESVLKAVEGFLRSKYGKVTANYGKHHEYLGMAFDFSTPGQVDISQLGLINNLIESVTESPRTTPAANDLFIIDQSAELCSPKQKEVFHSQVASLLYLSKKTRPDLLTPVSFLTTRVAAPTVQDMGKLKRVLRYLKGTKDKVLTLKAGPDSVLRVHAFIDASYAPHDDDRSHTGIVISLGCGTVYAKSSKQKLVTKSSTEAELVALATGLEEVIWLRRFLQTQGHTLEPSIVYQDNLSAKLLVTQGLKRASRTKHMSVRYFWAKDQIDAKRIIIKHLKTDIHPADVLTKALQGAKFFLFCDMLLGKVPPYQPSQQASDS